MKRQRNIYASLTLITLLTVTAEAAETDGITSIAYSCKIYEQIEDKFYIGRVLLQYFDPETIIENVSGISVVRIAGFEEENLTSDGFFVRYQINNGDLTRIDSINNEITFYIRLEASVDSFSRFGINFQTSSSLFDYPDEPLFDAEIEFLNQSPYSIKNLANHLTITVMNTDGETPKKTLYFTEFEEIKGWGWVMAFSIIFMFAPCIPSTYIFYLEAKDSPKSLGSLTMLTSLLTFIHSIRIIFIFWSTMSFQIITVLVFSIVQLCILGEKFLYPKLYKSWVIKVRVTFAVVLVVLLDVLYFESIGRILDYFFYFGNLALLLDMLLVTAYGHELKYLNFWLSAVWLWCQQAPFLLLLFCPLNLWYIPNGLSWGLFWLHVALWILPYPALYLVYCTDFFRLCGKVKKVDDADNRRRDEKRASKKVDSLESVRSLNDVEFHPGDDKIEILEQMLKVEKYDLEKYQVIISKKNMEFLTVTKRNRDNIAKQEKRVEKIEELIRKEKRAGVREKELSVQRKELKRQREQQIKKEEEIRQIREKMKQRGKKRDTQKARIQIEEENEIIDGNTHNAKAGRMDYPEADKFKVGHSPKGQILINEEMIGEAIPMAELNNLGGIKKMEVPELDEIRVNRNVKGHGKRNEAVKF